METIIQENQLVKVINESGLDKTKAQVLLDNFSNYFEIAADWENKTKSLVITNINQVAEMKMAREGRLFLSRKRIDVEHTRKNLKENSLREGQTIDAIAKILTNLIAPIERDLEQKEKFAEIQEVKRKAELKAIREIEVQSYIEFIPFGIDLSLLDDVGYKNLLMGAKLQLQAKKDAELKAEQKRIAEEKAEAEERERIRQENIRLKKEAEEERIKVEAERKKQTEILAKQKVESDAKQKAIEDQMKKEREAAEFERKRVEAENQKRIDAERKEREKLQAELRAKQEAEARENLRIQKEQKAKQDAEKKVAMAPDKDKLNIWVNSLILPDISLSSTNAINMSEDIQMKFKGFKNWAMFQINTL